MATPERITPSPRLRSAAQAERERLLRELGRVGQRMGTLRKELDGLAARAEGLRSRLALLAQLAYEPERDSTFVVPAAAGGDAAIVEAPRGELPAPLGYLRGAAIRHAAVRLLAGTAEPPRPIHYGRWYELLRDAGYGVAGRDPLATFLTQINRSPVVRRAGEPGLYALDLDAASRLRERLRRLHDELLALHRGQQTIEEIASVRERRAELTAECARVERALEEALEALGAETGDGSRDATG